MDFSPGYQYLFFRLLGFRDEERAVAEVSGSFKSDRSADRSEERLDDASEEPPPEGPPAESGARPEAAVRAGGRREYFRRKAHFAWRD